MSKRAPRRPVGTLIERALAGEDLRLRQQQCEDLAAREGLADEIRARIEPDGSCRLNADLVETVIALILENDLPSMRGTRPKSEQVKAIEAEAKAFWRTEYARAKPGSETIEEAQNTASRRLRRRYPQYAGKSTKTIADLMRRRKIGGN
jgi:hypothetical protein